MNYQEISSMSPEAINEAVARKLGWARPSYPHKIGETPNYCQSIEATWGIVETIKNEVLFTLWWHDGEWECNIESGNTIIQEKSITAPIAICKAFLKLR